MMKTSQAVRTSCRFLQLLAALWVVFSCSSALAVDTAEIMGGVRPVPSETDVTDEIYKKISKEYREVPFDDKFLAYSVRIPADWTKVERENLKTVFWSQRLFGEVAKFYGPHTYGPRSTFIVEAIQIEHEISIENWLINFILSNKYTLEGFRKNVTDSKETEIEAIYVRIDEFQNNKTFVNWIKAKISGPRLVIARFSIPQELWQEEQKWIIPAMKTFKLESPEDAPVEARDTYAFYDIAEFEYPRSWKLIATPSRFIDRMKASILNYSDRLPDFVDGRIDVVAIDKASPTRTAEEEIENVYKEYKKLDLELTPPEEISPEDYDTYYSVLLESFARSVAENPDKGIFKHEVYVASLSGEEYRYVVSLFTPSRNIDFYIWARNMAALKVVLETIRP